MKTKTFGKQEAAAVADQAFIVNAIPHITNEINVQIGILVNKTLASLDQSKLTPELALYAWMEMRALSVIPKRLATRAQIGANAGQSLEELTSKE